MITNHTIGKIKDAARPSALYTLKRANNRTTVVELANRASALGDKSHLADLAEKWLDLADRTQHQSTHTEHRTEEHPLIKRTFR